ncbi:hypothetical protein PQR66_31115 [Paraburkholderia agricolaris]|uniref:Short chain dehydrogenase n=1 Tax=Paraburkholderia agricolaris TaxID=2152888 RepID=A0ABW8ZZB9_9BURK|nr:hypothetical protein [Paraburkholderia agricolaris]
MNQIPILEGKTALVTGGAGGIGLASAQALAQDGGCELRTNPLLDDTIAHLYGEAALHAVRTGHVPVAA